MLAEFCKETGCRRLLLPSRKALERGRWIIISMLLNVHILIKKLLLAEALHALHYIYINKCLKLITYLYVIIDY